MRNRISAILVLFVLTAAAASAPAQGVVTGLAAGGEYLYVGLRNGTVVRIASGGAKTTITIHGLWLANGARSIAADSNGNLYVTGYPATAGTGRYNGGMSVAEVTPAGVETDRAFDGFTQEPYAIAVDSHSGDLYIAGIHKILRITPSGEETPWGIGWNAPGGLAVDSSGNLYVADRDIFKLNPNGAQAKLWGKQYSGYEQVGVDTGGDVYICCHDVGLSGVVERLPANGGPAADAAPQLFGSEPGQIPLMRAPIRMALGSRGTLFVADRDGRVVAITPGGEEAKLPGTGSAVAVAVGPSGQVLVSATQHLTTPGLTTGHLIVIEPNGKLVNISTATAAPGAIAMDAAGSAYFADATSNRIFKVSPSGAMREIPVRGLDHAFGLVVDRSGAVFLADSNKNRVVKIAPDGGETTVGHGLDRPVGLATDKSGDLYIADTGNNRVVEINPAGRQTTVPASGLVRPLGVAADHSGDVYIADTGNRRVLEITADGAQLPLPAAPVAASDIAVDAAGNVYLTGVPAGIERLSPGGTFRVLAIQGNDTPPLPLAHASLMPASGTKQTVVPPTPPAPLLRDGKALYLLAASCRVHRWMRLTGVDAGLYYATAGQELAGVRDLGISGCGLYDVRNDQAGDLYVLSGIGTLDVDVVHENDPRHQDFFDGHLWSKMSLGNGPLGGYVYTPTAAAGAAGQSYLIATQAQALPNGKRAFVVERFLAEPGSDQPRVAAGTPGDYARLRFSGQVLPPFLLPADDVGKDATGAQSLGAGIDPDGVAVDFPSRTFAKIRTASNVLGFHQIIAPLPPALRASAEAGSKTGALGAQILAATKRYLVIAGPSSKFPEVNAWIYDRHSRRWSSLQFEAASRPDTVRIWGNWLVVPEGKSGSPPPAYTAQSTFAGELELIDLADGRSTILNTGDADSEVLDISGQEVVYRIRDRILLATISRDQMGPARVLARDPVVEAVHWAFWSRARPTPTL